MSPAALRDEARAAEAWTSFNLRGGPSVASQARSVIEPLGPTLGKDVSADLALMISELVTNSYRHSGAGDGEINVEVEVSHDRVRAEIRDQGEGFKAEPVPAKKRGSGGWGLVIVDRLAESWGVRSGSPSCVWFELAR
jgi:anti-sigma regulatory factor (Ser/Thr protein kinase)